MALLSGTATIRFDGTGLQRDRRNRNSDFDELGLPRKLTKPTKPVSSCFSCRGIQVKRISNHAETKTALAFETRADRPDGLIDAGGGGVNQAALAIPWPIVTTDDVLPREALQPSDFVHARDSSLVLVLLAIGMTTSSSTTLTFACVPTARHASRVIGSGLTESAITT
jgi:hypothetical protein